MKNAIFFTALLIIGCQAPSTEPDAALEVFKRNSETVRAYLDNWQNETPDYSLFKEDYFHYPTNFSLVRDTVTLDEMIKEDQIAMATYDFELVHDLTLLPGANPITTDIDGSVRFYSTWKITKTATDSTEARSATLLVYYSFDFDEAGKISYLDRIGDYTGLFNYLNGVE